MKFALFVALLAIFGSLSQGKPVNKKKKLKDRPRQGEYCMPLSGHMGIKISDGLFEST